MSPPRPEMATMRILVATDAWHPQINGVVRTLERVAQHAPAFGAEVTFLTPQAFRSVPMPSYGEIRLSLTSPRQVAEIIAASGATHIHVATEGPIGLAVRRACLNEGRPFTTSYHTRFPEYLRARAPVPLGWSYAGLRHFHNAGAGTLVATRSLARELEGHGFTRVRLWSRGVDAELYRPRAERVLNLPGPIFLYVGRVAVEKNIEAFLALDLPGSKVVVGEGPAREGLQQAYPLVTFLGAQTGERLAALYASADVFVFPSRTDTFGIVLLEALASGLPVAAFPVTGPLDVIEGTGAGVLSEDLRAAAMSALSIDRAIPRQVALGYRWEECARVFVAHVSAAGTTVPAAA